MSDLFRLHYAPDNASMIVRLALEEIGARYETVLVDRASQAQRGSAFRALNPAGKIPVLETKDGPIFETAAILLFLADRHGALAPRPEDPHRGPFLSWLFYLSNTVHANLRLSFYPGQYSQDDPGCANALRAGAHMQTEQSLALLEVLAAEQWNWFNAATPSLLDLYCAPLLRWMALYPKGETSWFSLTNWPNLRVMAARLEERKSVTALCRAEGMTLHPFTNPEHPNPPEGVAL